MAQSDPDCLFGKIIAGELPAVLVAQDERTVAFMDINPAARATRSAPSPAMTAIPCACRGRPGRATPT